MGQRRHYGSVLTSESFLFGHLRFGRSRFKGQQLPGAYDAQWAFRDKFKQAGITAILSAGFDPGVVSVFAAYAAKYLFDEIDTIDVLDINAGDHGKKFATNFDPETNLLEIQGDSIYWDAGSGNAYLAILGCWSLISLNVANSKCTPCRMMSCVR